MKELIKIQFKDESDDQFVDARELWKGLESKRAFGNWVKKKVLENPFFEENTDYSLINKSVKQTGRGGGNRKDYLLSIDTAKKIAMSEQTPRGNEVRNYFIACEKKIISLQPRQLNLKDSLLALNESILAQVKLIETNEVLQIKNDIQEKKIEAQKVQIKKYELDQEFIDKLFRSKDSLSITSVANILDIGRNKLFGFLREQKILKDGGIDHNLPFQTYLDRKYFVVRLAERVNHGNVTYYKVPQATPKGLKYVYKIFVERYNPVKVIKNK